MVWNLEKNKHNGDFFSFASRCEAFSQRPFLENDMADMLIPSPMGGAFSGFLVGHPFEFFGFFFWVFLLVFFGLFGSALVAYFWGFSSK